jgi:hypothetical protein
MWCSHEDGKDGEEREKWDVARQGGGKTKPIDAKPLDAKKFRELDNLFGKHLKGLGPAEPAEPKPEKKNGKPRPQFKNVTAPPSDDDSFNSIDDDVPF